MQQTTIIFPMAALVLLTFATGLWMLKLRFKAVRQHGLSPAYFKLNQGGELPEDLIKATRHYANLHEAPLLFYAACVTLIAAQRVDTVFLLLAWAFVAARYVHAFVHVTYNNLKHRGLAFLLGIVMLFAIWTRLLVHLVA
jgi:hypothetical protein